MEKLPPIEKIYEAYSALADRRINIEGNMAYVASSNGKKIYKVEWEEDAYTSTDNATLWQGYPGYPVIGVLVCEKKLQLDESVIHYFSEINWHELNQKHKHNYRAALLEVFEQKKLSDKEIKKIESETQQIYEQLQRLDIKIVRKIKRKSIDLKNLLDVRSREELRRWLEKNHKTEPECWVVVKRGRPKNDGTFWYIDAVEEAMCFGWIDSTTKTISEGVTAQRLAPRNPKSLWSELNKERCRRMERLGLMTDAGRAVLPDMTDAGFVIDDEILEALKSDPIVWENFNKFPVLYQRVRIDTIQIKKKQPELFASRLEKFISNTKEGIMFGEWNDNGRLLYDGKENNMKNKLSKIKIGSHVKMTGKEMFLASVKEAASYGANVLMLYTGAPQNTRRKEIDELNINLGWEYAKKSGIEDVIVHAPYIINLANTVKPENFELGVSFLKKEIERTVALHSKILVLHPGSHLGEGIETGIAQIIKGLNLVLEDNEDDVCIALETMAGKGSELGATFDELKMIFDGVDKRNRLRVCFDTCHVNDAGYDLVGDYDGVWQKFDKLIGINQIAVIHINDSLNPCGSRKDRHANIGNGCIGMDTLKKVVHDERFIDIPKILETPWLSEGDCDKKTIPPYKGEIEKLLLI